MKQEKFICQNCGKEFFAKKGSNRKYCCHECSGLAHKGVSNVKNKKEKVKVTCVVCGKEEYVSPCRAKTFKTCCKECHKKYYSSLFNKQIECHCEVCGKTFYLKPYAYNRSKHHCCSTACLNKLKETLYLGEGNHQFGLKGSLNSSFKGQTIYHKNGRLIDEYVYDSDYPDLDTGRAGRVTVHRYTVWKNYDKFNPIFFTFDNLIVRLKDKILIHHIDCDHTNNDINNLIPLTRKQHTSVHNNLTTLGEECFKKVIGVVKLGELLESLGEDNQQPSLNSNILEGPETNNRVLIKDSNVDTSALLNEINKIIDDYIVQTEKITQDAYNASIKELSESKIKSLETNTNGLQG